ncbi:MAG: TetR/AcrR family transcriptional regulator [Bacteroidales bacterium]|nr:TetR/AcrR family transcriptional regulator [Bacteroidales bacterium]MDD4217507.1 TetR/AcrR family transcriptional regulator [Bacteroidales bacterium]MDY0142473.1 TetR/AcrR family transcriptional regulator [Bacteroidales bacterium]
MGKDKKLNAEQKIIEAAADIFETKGFEGARMQQIADKAGINKALLHYYFRSKDLLFEKVFLKLAGKIFLKFIETFNIEGSIFDKIEMFLQIHQDLLYKNRKFPIFFFNEITRNPDLMRKLMLNLEISKKFQEITKQFDQEKKDGIIRQDVEVSHLIVNIISLSVFPYIGSPAIKEIMKEFDLNYEQFLDERRTMIAQFVINSIKV